jgi:hypothetical protein
LFLGIKTRYRSESVDLLPPAGVDFASVMLTSRLMAMDLSVGTAVAITLDPAAIHLMK